MVSIETPSTDDIVLSLSLLKLNPKWWKHYNNPQSPNAQTKKALDESESQERREGIETSQQDENEDETEQIVDRIVAETDSVARSKSPVGNR